MKIKELREKSEKELQTLLSELQEKQRDASFKLAQKQMKDLGAKVKIRKDIARILTIFKERVGKTKG